MMRPLRRRASATRLAVGFRILFSLPKPVRHALAGPPVRSEGQELDPDMRLFLRLQRLTGRDLPPSTPERARRWTEEGDAIVRGRLVPKVESEPLSLPGDLAARLYTPTGLPAGRGLLIYFHGGGWVVGSLDSHDNVCRFLARHGNVRVLSVAYRLAPEHPFPAATDDAYAAFRYVHDHAAELGASPEAVAVGGDSAGGNLAIVTALQAARSGGPRPAYQLLIYPATDHTTRRRSRELYGHGFLLTDVSMTWFSRHYTGGGDVKDPLMSPLLASDLAELPPAYVAVAGFDPLRDEGEAFATSLADAGVPVTLHRFGDLIHGYANFFNFSKRARQAMLHAASALRQAIGEPGTTPERATRQGPERTSQPTTGPRTRPVPPRATHPTAQPPAGLADPGVEPATGTTT